MAAMPSMIRINLLDWREARREQRRRQFLTALGISAGAAAAIIVAILFGYGNAIDAQEARNRFLRQEITTIDKQIKEIETLEETRENLITRMRIIEELQQSRAQIVHYFDQIVATLPEGVYLTSLKQDGDKTTVDGIAESNGRVSSYMVNIDDSPWFANPQLVVIKSRNDEARRFANFTLTFKSVTPDSKQNEDNHDSGREET